MEEVELLWLPIEVIHHIFSYLNAKEKAQASVLSENWLIAWRTNRRLEFEDWDFYKPNWHPQNCCIYKTDPKKFRNCVNDTLQRYQEDHIEEFKLSINLTSDDLDSLDEWLRMAVEKGVEVLDLELCADMLSSPYILPEEILAAKSLSEFKVAGCKFPKQFNNTIKIMCKNIRVLKLWNVYIDNEIFHCLVEGYPFVNDLRIEECAGLNTIKVINLFSLEQLFIHSVGSKPMYGVVNLEVDAPSLEKTELGTVRSVLSLEFHSSPNLKNLSLERTYIYEELFDDLMNKSPNLEFLEVKNCGGLRSIDLTSRTQKHYLCLSSIPLHTIIEIEIDPPRNDEFHPYMSFMAHCVSP